MAEHLSKIASHHSSRDIVESDENLGMQVSPVIIRPYIQQLPKAWLTTLADAWKKKRRIYTLQFNG